MTKTMPYLLTILAVAIMCLLASGCSTVSASYAGAEFHRMSFGTNITAADIEITVGADGSKSARFQGISNDQTQALEAVTRSAVEAAVKAVAP